MCTIDKLLMVYKNRRQLNDFRSQWYVSSFQSKSNLLFVKTLLVSKAVGYWNKSEHRIAQGLGLLQCHRRLRVSLLEESVFQILAAGSGFQFQLIFKPKRSIITNNDGRRCSLFHLAGTYNSVHNGSSQWPLSLVYLTWKNLCLGWKRKFGGWRGFLDASACKVCIVVLVFQRALLFYTLDLWTLQADWSSGIMDALRDDGASCKILIVLADLEYAISSVFITHHNANYWPQNF